MQGNYFFQNKFNWRRIYCYHTLLENAWYKQHVRIQAVQFTSSWARLTSTEKLFLASLTRIAIRLKNRFPFHFRWSSRITFWTLPLAYISYQNRCFSTLRYLDMRDDFAHNRCKYRSNLILSLNINFGIIL